jgi:phenylalanyl-tRNA synthetase beta chain
MRVPLKWLSDYVDITIPVEELARRLTIAGVEVGEIIRSGGDWDGVRVAEVVKVEPHPNADRLTLPTVDLGDGDTRRVVCGAPNIAAGQKVAFAPEGTPLIDGRTGKATVLTRAMIRGVESAGMVLSEKELGISESHAGILVLPEDSPVGAPLSSVLGETIFDLDLTPNRPDLLSVVGVAREVAALTGQRVREPSIEYEATGKLIKGRAGVKIADPDLCPRYVAALIEDVKIGESPPWLQERLTAAGLRPINNVVDITNYVMLEIGQPLHAFDFTRLKGGRIIVRRARSGETLTLLDGTKRELGNDMLVIADAEDAVALAGVMGGENSEVSPDSTTILLESANFSATSIRRTSTALKARTDASVRFEKGLSPQLPKVAAARAMKLMVEICGGKAAEGLLDVFPGKAADIKITLTQERLHRVLGVELPAARVRGVLEGLGFGCRWVPPDHYIVRVPYWRTDVNIADDVIEEVARIVGYDEMPTTQLRGAIPHHEPQPRVDLRERVRDALAAAGMQEIITYSMTSLEALQKVMPPEELTTTPPLRLANPMSREHEYARTSPRAAVLQTLAQNLDARGGLRALFEAGRIYLPRPDDLPHEIEVVCGVITGRRPDHWGQPGEEHAGFFDAKAYIERALETLGVEGEYLETVDFAYLPGRTAEVFVGEARVGLLGQIHPRVAASFDIEDEVAMFELDLDALLPHVQTVVHYQPVSPYPSVEEDLAVIVPEDVSAGRVQGIIEGFPLVRAASIFDVYTGPPIPSGRKSLAFSVSYQSPDRTLKDEDVARQRERIVARLRAELGAELRG